MTERGSNSERYTVAGYLLMEASGERNVDWLMTATYHYLSSAENAHLNAYILSHIQDGPVKFDINKTFFKGTPRLAFEDGFTRESALAMELILKAAISARIEGRDSDLSVACVPHTHNVRKLWTVAGLPNPSEDDDYRLLNFSINLIWKGRYPFPKSASEYFRNKTALIEKLAHRFYPDKVSWTPIKTNWTEFEHLYSTARSHVEGLIERFRLVPDFGTTNDMPYG